MNDNMLHGQLDLSIERFDGIRINTNQLTLIELIVILCSQLERVYCICFQLIWLAFILMKIITGEHIKINKSEVFK
jgi:hypothetical protein